MEEARKSSPSRMDSVISFLSRLSPFSGQNEESPRQGLNPRLSSIFKRKKKPEWVLPFLSASYFGRCQKHRDIKKNAQRYFCTECPDSGPLCKACQIEAHADHMYLKLTKYSASDVLRGAHSGCIDTSDVYPYISRGKSSYFLRSDREKSLYRKCLACRRSFPNRKLRIPADSKRKLKREMRRIQRLRNSAKYCSLMCKFEDLRRSCRPAEDLMSKRFDYRDYCSDSEEEEEEEEEEEGDEDEEGGDADWAFGDIDDEKEEEVPIWDSVKISLISHPKEEEVSKDELGSPSADLGEPEGNSGDVQSEALDESVPETADATTNTEAPLVKWAPLKSIRENENGDGFSRSKRPRISSEAAAAAVAKAESTLII